MAHGLNAIRTAFLEYYRGRGHEVVPSAPLVPRNDPTLLFVNAGMVPFKNVFTGQETRPYVRATSSQKCVRAGGKHNDLDNVGYTARHHTFFEMLGNFSFGDYFKDEAIASAWQLVTGEFALPVERLLVTVYADDDEAFDLWRRIAGLPEQRIIRIGTSANFWSMGETGPCGPCSEIFYDHGDHIAGGPPGSPDEDGDRFVEIWNLVFMQFDQIAGGSRVPLPRPSIDTGMGIERITAALQGVHDNYEIDLFRHLIAASEAETATRAEGGSRASHRVIADHLRASSFLIADGVLPSNEGRGYVLRRIMRRAMRHAHLLGAQDPLLWRLLPVLVAEMGAAYPELVRAEPLIRETLKLEEASFRLTLERGLRLLDEEVAGLSAGGVLAGEAAFRLYDTYGFPIDLTQDALRERGMAVDLEGFDRAMARQRADARAAWSGSGEQATEAVWLALRERVGPSAFVGYEADQADGRVLALVVDGREVAEARDRQDVGLIADGTPFYAESGGQVGDTGTLVGPRGRLAVTDTQRRAGDVTVHFGRVEGELRVGDALDMTVDADRRDATRANHSATHLLHKALRAVLGLHVTQKGSFVGPERLRFDFSHPKAMHGDEIDTVEGLVNAQIRRNAAVGTRLMAPEAAIEAGALALFGEKYGSEVRVLSMGDAGADLPYSVELCGGTHVRRTGDIGLFKIVGESAVAAGVRRIEALTGEAARLYLAGRERAAREAAAYLKTTPDELPQRVVSLIEERRRLERELAEAKRKLATGGGAGPAKAANDVREIAGLQVAARVFEDLDPKDLRGLVDETKKRLGSGIVAFAAVKDGKAAITVGVTDDLAGRYSAVELVRRGAPLVGGKGGGGRPDLAQAGGPDGAAAQAALDAITQSLEELAGAA